MSAVERIAQEPERPIRYRSWAHVLAMVQGMYDLLGGLWPLLHLQSFEQVTGPKSDDWLVRSVAGILVVVGIGLLYDASHHRLAAGMRRTAAGISLVLALVALISSTAGWVSWLYFIDGLAHASFFLGWVVLAVVSRRIQPA